MTISVAALFVARTAAEILSLGLEIAAAVGLPVTSWRTGDPTRSLYVYIAEVLATVEGVAAEHVKASFLSSATGDWLKVLALETFGVEAVEATYAAGALSVTLHNGGGGFYEIESGDLTFKNSATGATYHCTSGGTLSAGATVAFDIVADVPGSEGTSAANEIDELVTTLLGVTVVSSLAVIGLDEQSEDSIKAQCLASLGALSPSGPADAYEYVARNSDLTGVTDITRAKSTDNSTTGVVTVYVAGPTGPVAAASVTAALAAIFIWAKPLCITPTVVNATPATIDVDVTIAGDDIPTDYASTIESALGAYFSTIDIGGIVSESEIIYAVRSVIPQAYQIAVTSPASDLALSAGVVAVLGDVDVVVA